MTPSYVYFKEGKEPELLLEFQELHARGQLVAEDMGRWLSLKGYKLIITDIMSDQTEDEALGRVSPSHREGRAFDFRTRGIPQHILDELEKRFEHIYKHWAAISLASGKPNLILYHDNGNGRHAHVQIRRGL